MTALTGKNRPLLRGGMTASEAFAKVMRGYAAAHQASQDAILATDDPEAVHAARVVLRRMRSVLRGFADMLSDKHRDSLNDALADRFRQLGPLRDADVRAAAVGDDLTAAEAARLRAALRDDLATDDAPAIHDLIERLLTRLQRAAQGGKRHRLAQARVGIIASRALQTAWTELLSFGADIGALGVDDRHEFRKRAKDMRYLSDVFAPLWPDSHADKMLARLAKLQDALGALNDLAVMREDLAAGRLDNLPKGADSLERKAARDAAKHWSRLAAIAPWWQAPPP